MAQATALRDEIDEIMPGVVADRRDFHEHPELAFQEVRTAGIVADRLRALGVEDVRTGIAQTGVTGLIRGRRPGAGKTVLLRADMDALPILEENDVEYRSQTPGVMHACGHDAHTAMLLGVPAADGPPRRVLGHCEGAVSAGGGVTSGGAKPMIDAGVLEDPKVDAAFGLHIDQDNPVGMIELRSGPAMAAADRFHMIIRGRADTGQSPTIRLTQS